ncbi:MAG: FAD-dependent oxidoreductase [Hydrogenophaga sp.]|nr:FAD-dependent oxidoreductase [Hydrogenophaga sp.]
MKIAIVGAGVNGLATAHELLLAGHDVTVFERHATAAEAGSFAPAGLLHAAWALAWAEPQTRLHLPWSAQGAALRWRPQAGWAGWAWRRRWRSATRRRPAPARQALADLLALGQERHADLTTELELDHDRSDGLLVLASDERRFAQAAARAIGLREMGLAVRAVSAEEARTIEPALNPSAPLAGAVHLAGPAVANCREWTLLLRQALMRGGGRFVARQPIAALEPHDGSIDVVAPDGERETFGAAVVCAGVDAIPLLQGLGLRSPFAVWWSHSLSAPMREPVDAPQSGVLDLQSGVTVTRLGHRVRASGGWDLGGDAGPAEKAAIARLAQTASLWFPAAARLGGTQSALQSWRGAVLASPDGLPLVGASRVPGVWLNIAHGPLGWALACGAAHHLAQTITDEGASSISSALSPARLGL